MSQTRETVVRSSGGISLLTVLGIVFIVLKLVGTIDWSWWWVLLPIYGPWALVLGLSALFLIVGAIVAAFKR